MLAICIRSELLLRFSNDPPTQNNNLLHQIAPQGCKQRKTQKSNLPQKVEYTFEVR